jgi:putative flippase GtrA
MSWSKLFEHGHSHRKSDRYRVVRYFVIGGISTVMDFLLFAILLKGFGVKWYYANVASFTLTSLVHYALSIRFVFESGARFAKHQEILLTFLASGVGLLVNQLALCVLVNLLGLEVLIAKIGATGTTFFGNYIARQNFFFASRTHGLFVMTGYYVRALKSSSEMA